ncbi:MAG: TonB-dependent receptor domain-containing protein [Chitinophagaceae bacterium]
MKFLNTFLLFIFLSFTSYAQIEREQQPAPDMPSLKLNSNRLYGKLIDKKTGRPVEAASVQLFLADKDSIVTGMLSKANGDFSFSDLPAFRNYKVVISAVGYEPTEQLIETAAGRETRNATIEKDLGNIMLEADVQELGGVTVVSNKPVLELGVDRRVYNVAKSLTSTGGTAIDVMKNIPSLTVDIDGNVELRNSSPQIFIDGRPTILTLDQVPADNIEKVELITNPSAKYDAASSAGIINIVLKKNKRIGLNGIITAAVGTPRIINSNLNLNLRQGKFNFFMSSGYNQSGGKARGETQRQNKSNGSITDYFNQNSVNNRFRRFYSLRFGADYFIDNRNTFSITQDFGKGRFSNDEEQQQQFLNSDRSLVYNGIRFANGRSKFNRNSTKLNYKHSFPQTGRELTADITYNHGENSENSAILNSYFFPDGTEYRPSSLVRNEGSSNNNQWTFQSDYAHPLGEESKIEAGIRSYHNESKSFYNAFAVDNSSETKLPLSNNYSYNEMVNALYATYSGKKKNLSYQFGLRAEHSKFSGTLIDSAFKFGYEYPAAAKNIWDALFPSVFLTKKIGEQDQVQLNYSRRIRRPNFWQINPFIDINDPVNLRQGNPQLKPEFINSFEVNYSKDYKNGNFLTSLYFRNNPDDITQYSDTITASQYQQLQDAGVDPNAILNTFINAGTTNRYGAEFVIQHKWTKNFNITPSFDLQYRTVKATVNDLDLSNKGFSWEAQLTTDYKIEAGTKSIFNNLSFQLMGEYESSEVLPQGKRKPEYSVDFALRKDFLKNNKATITLGINDVFNTQRWGTIYDTESFYQDSYRRWNVRNFRVTFSYKFGKADFSLMKQNNRGGDDD